MNIVCQKCSTSFQVDDEKVAARSNGICPECQRKQKSASPAVEKSALSLGGSPATEGRRVDRNAAPAYKEHGSAVTKRPVNDAEKLAQMLASLLGQGAGFNSDGPIERASWNARKALVCSTEENREKIAQMLAQAGYEVFVALDTRQAVERMREKKLDVVLLDPQFDGADQGAAFVVREVNVLRPAQRRRVFFVLLSPTLRTLDAHGAFLNNVNAIMNLKDLDELVRVLDQGLREFNDLYQDFNQALRLSAI